MKRKNTLWRGLASLFAFVFVFAMVAKDIASGYTATIDTALKTNSEVFVAEGSESDPLYDKFVPPAEFLNADGKGNSRAIIEAAMDLNRRQETEGAVLLKNNTENGQGLPLKSGAQVTLFGLRSHVALHGSNFGVKSAGPIVTLEQALTKDQTDFANTIARIHKLNWRTGEINIESTMPGGWHGEEFAFQGAGFGVNPTMVEIYDKLNETYTRSENMGSEVNFDPGEPSVAEIANVKGDYESSFTQYGDAAIVVLARPSGESKDYLPGSVAEGLGYEQPLSLTQNERDIIEKAKQASDNVIILMNTAQSVDIDYLKHDPDIDAILWIGYPGNYGMIGVADILSGKVSPSGGLWDIWAAQSISAPAMQNMGDFTYGNAKEVITRSQKNLSTKYLIEAESIYAGYRYYETRYYDAVLGQGNATAPVGTYGSKGDWNYEEEVSWSFGYGQSYTEFKQELQGEPEFSIEKNPETGHTDAYATFNVNVTNVGKVPGKVSVQIYGQAPYTPGGIEKAAIQLLNFGKSKVIEPGQSEVVPVKVDLQFIANYDNKFDNGDGTFGTYVLEPGDYYFAVGNGAHDALNNIMAAQGIAAEKLAGPSDASKAYKKTINEDFLPKTVFSLSKTGAKIHNQLDYADWNHFQPGEVTYLSRADWAGTYPKTYKDMVLTSQEHIDLLNGKLYQIKKNDDTSAIKWGQKNGAKFYKMAGVPFDDPSWETLLDNVTLEEAQYMATYGGPVLPGMKSIGLAEAYSTENCGNGLVVPFNASKDPSAPWSVSPEDPNYAWNPQVFCNAPLMASSFNPEMSHELGKFVGLESLFVGIPIPWGPGLNTHRHQYNGRNGEYYSEDPVLSGMCAMEFAIGALEHGLIAAPKHFAFNDQETNRAGVAPYMLEQRAREIELRAYQIAFEATKYDTDEKDAGMRGLMTSFSKIGPVECTTSRELCTNILQGEWGFKGYAVTDIYDDTDLYGSVLTSGVTNYDIRGVSGFYTKTRLETDSHFTNQVDGNRVDAKLFEKDAYAQESIKKSVKNTLYALSQSNLMNRYNSTTRMETRLTWWSGAILGTAIGSGVLTLACAALYIFSDKSKKKEAK